MAMSDDAFDEIALAYRMYRGKRLRRGKTPDGRAYVLDTLKVDIMMERFDLGLRKVEVRSSAIHGKGVFAVQDIAAGEVATLYPADWVAYMPHETRRTPGHFELIIPSDRVDMPEGGFLDTAYTYDVCANFSIQGDPTQHDDPNYLGHMLNDGARATVDPRSHRIYCACTLAKSNCKFEIKNDGITVAVTAKRDITAGEELLVPYGVGYWTSHSIAVYRRHVH